MNPIEKIVIVYFSITCLFYLWKHQAWKASAYGFMAIMLLLMGIERQL